MYIMYIYYKTCKSATANLGQRKKFISYYEKYKEQVTFQTMVVSNVVLVLTNGNQILVIIID